MFRFPSKRTEDSILLFLMEKSAQKKIVSIYGRRIFPVIRCCVFHPVMVRTVGKLYQFLKVPNVSYGVSQCLHFTDASLLDGQREMPSQAGVPLIHAADPLPLSLVALAD